MAALCSKGLGLSKSNEMFCTGAAFIMELKEICIVAFAKSSSQCIFSQPGCDQNKSSSVWPAKVTPKHVGWSDNSSRPPPFSGGCNT